MCSLDVRVHTETAEKSIRKFSEIRADFARVEILKTEARNSRSLSIIVPTKQSLPQVTKATQPAFAAE